MSRTGSSEPYELAHVRVRKESRGALLVQLDDERKVWIPRSLIDTDSEVWAEGDEGRLVIPEWLAIDRGI
jgi:hypothetical protein